MGNPLDNHSHGDSCMPEYNVARGSLYNPQEWNAMAPDTYGIKFIVAADVQKSRQVAVAVTKAQEYLLKQFKTDLADTKLYMNVETFQDGCRHSTGWSETSQDITSKSTRWHCYQTKTRISESFQEMQGEKTRANILIILGDRFDDDMRETLALAKKLHELHGTRIFAIPLNNDVSGAYKQLTAATNGVTLSGFSVGSRPEDIEALLKEITQAIIAEEIGNDLDALPAPASKQLAEVRNLLLNP
jgi:hypothetical protein